MKKLIIIALFFLIFGSTIASYFTYTSKKVNTNDTLQIKHSKPSQMTPLKEIHNSPNIIKQPNNEHKMKVLNIIYIPISDNSSIDIEVTGSLPFKDATALKKHIDRTTSTSLKKLTEATRYHAYKNTKSEPSLKYSLLKTKIYYESLPVGSPIPWNKNANRPDYTKILEREKICDYIDKSGIKEIWLWGYHTNKIEPVESNMSMGIDIKRYWNHNGYGDISNSEMTNDLPICQNTYVLYNLNYGRGVGEVLENHTHHIERVMNFIEPNLWNKFVGACGEQDVYSCGWTHYPPNIMQYCSGHDYEWYSKQPVMSDCMDWTPDNIGKKEQINCTTWSNTGCKDDGGISFKVWWMQNIPGKDNAITYNGNPLINWWDAIGDFDQIVQRKSLTQF